MDSPCSLQGQYSKFLCHIYVDANQNCRFIVIVFLIVIDHHVNIMYQHERIILKELSYWCLNIILFCSVSNKFAIIFTLNFFTDCRDRIHHYYFQSQLSDDRSHLQCECETVGEDCTSWAEPGHPQPPTCRNIVGISIHQFRHNVTHGSSYHVIGEGHIIHNVNT